MNKKQIELLDRILWIIASVLTMCAFAVFGAWVVSQLTDHLAVHAVVAMGSGVGGAWVMQFGIERFEAWCVIKLRKPGPWQR